MQQNKKKIKICFIAPKAYQLFNPKVKSTFGGAEVQLYILAKELIKENIFDVNFIVGDYGQPEVEEVEKVKLHKFPSPRKSDNLLKKASYAIILWKLLGKVKADVLFTTTSNSVTALVSTYCKFRNAKHFHRTSSDEGVNLGFIKKNGLMGKLYKYGLENSDIVITQNEEHRKMLLENHKISAVVIKNSITGQINEGKNKNFILWVSRCHPLKKPELFLQLAKNFEKEKFLMICPPSSDHKPYFKKIKKEAKNQQNVEFIDFVPFDKIQSYYDQAKIYVCTSDYEGFPNTLIQSGIAKTPFLSLKVNPDNILTQYDCGLFADGSMDKMKDGLKKILEDELLHKKLSENIQRYTLDNHDARINCKKLTKLIVENVEQSK